MIKRATECKRGAVVARTLGSRSARGVIGAWHGFRPLLVAISLLALGVGAPMADGPPPGSARPSAAVVYVSDNAFDDVMDGLRLAIEQRGFVINKILHMNQMLERTGADLGMEQALFGQAQSVEFCSATLSRRMMSEDPSRIVNCPFIIAVYTLADQPGKTLVAHRRISAAELETSAAMRDVASMLASIAEQSLSW